MSQERSIIIAAAVFAASLMAAAPASPQVRPPSKQPSKQDRFLSGPPLSFDDLAKAAGVIYEGRLKAAVRKRGLAVPLTAEQIGKLKAAGASEDLLTVLRSLSPPSLPKSPAPVAVVAPEPPTGSLVVRCEPAECDVMVNGKPFGLTIGGLLELKGLAAGEHVADLQREGYLGERIPVTIHANQSRVASVRLKPGLDLQRKAGAELARKIIAKIGDTTARDSLSWTGTATITPTEATRTEWKLVARQSVAMGMTYLEIEGAGLHWWISVRGADTKAGGSAKIKGSAIAMEMEKLARMFHAYQPSGIVRRVSAPDVLLMAQPNEADTGGHRVLAAGEAGGAMSITVDDQGLPIRVTEGGLDAGYSDYAQIEGGVYPRTMSIGVGTTLRFTQIRSNPKLTSRDFRR